MEKQELHNRIDQISNEILRHLVKLVSSCQIEDPSDLNTTNHIQIQKSALLSSSSMAILECWKQYFQVIKVMKNDVLLADVTQIKGEMENHRNKYYEDKGAEKKALIDTLDKLNVFKARMNEYFNPTAKKPLE